MLKLSTKLIFNFYLLAMGRKKSKSERSASLVDYLLRNGYFQLDTWDGETGNGDFSYDSPLAKAARELKRPLNSVKYQWRTEARDLFLKITGFCSSCKKKIDYSKAKSQWCPQCRVIFHERLTCATFSKGAWKCRYCKTPS
jgi:hypothetical protein